jgi:hypothetical protein
MIFPSAGAHESRQDRIKRPPEATDLIVVLEAA